MNRTCFIKQLSLWAECELPRDGSSWTHELRIHDIVDGRLKTRRLATMAARPRDIFLLDDRHSWDMRKEELI